MTDSADRPFPHNLTEREAEVIDALIETGTYKGVAQHLGITFHTVNDHMKHAYRKAGVHHRVQLVARYVAVRGLP